MASPRSKVLLVAVLGAVVGASGCQIVPAAYRLDLWMTDWAITKLNEAPLEDDITISFNEAGAAETAHLTTPCGTSTMGFAMDTDGDGLGFDFPRPVESRDCASGQRQTEAALYEALAGVEEWSVQDDDHILLSGLHDLSLVRIP